MKERMQAAKVHEVHELAKKSSKREQFLISSYLFQEGSVDPTKQYCYLIGAFVNKERTKKQQLSQLQMDN